ncbi:polysaccharide pyruvyl transferase family protein [Vibrio vulnificus]|uniref:polysaccharide pyruvyl transferase family protein n=1 Tax=Vibrio vulnificus TaxID=672 RepID=UPI00092C8A7E|nr:polysaccharide pyruvyl transferase family protein [Vibrio vulnificus]EHZ2550971.1 polysaccharide pyruvyl transferase family protein [Vibrio vulnificus]OJI37243.1 colanic acid biosynthesis protein [Vibrio vulnificus]HAS8124065.1 polysaccharide pyruvyl transferase family protein [Vibrio vulnificus]
MEDNVKKVLMVGLFGVYNYGCEAIVRGSVKIIKHKYNNKVEIDLATPSVQDDTKRLHDCDVNIIDRNFAKYRPLNILRKLSNKIGINFPVLIERIENIEQYDAIYSVGGDIYTLDHEGFAPLNFMKFTNKCMDLGIPYYMLCSSIGPFNENKELEYIKPHLKRISKIYAREFQTIDYLLSLGIEENVQFLPDPAFQVDNTTIKVERYDKKINIGINLSPLSAIHFYEDISSGIAKQAKAIESILDEDENITIYLIPHVKSHEYHDDDFSYLYNIYKSVGEVYKSRVSLIETDAGFIGRKATLINMDYVIAARMHCAINAVCCHVPTLFLSYSKKAVGMSKLIYGVDNGVMSLPEFENSSKILSMLRELPEFKANLKKLQTLEDYI